MSIDKHRFHRLAIPALAALTLAAAPAAADVLLPYGGGFLAGVSGFKYTIGPLGSEIPGFEAPAYDDSGWADGISPFGGSGGDDGICPALWPTVRTPWSPNNSDLFVRFHLDLCPGVSNVVVGVSIDNDLALFVNGFEVEPVGGCPAPSPDGLCQTENCAVLDKLTFQVPDGLLVPGDNVFAIHARDRHVVAYLDIQVSADTSSAVCEPPPPDNEPPACEGAFADPGDLWPPNHKWHSIAIGGVSDPDGDEVAVTVTSIFQDEPVDAKGNGDGKTCPDGDGVGTGTAWVRAERAGGADGRVYHIGFEATDGEGATCQGTVGVCVPHDQGGGSQCIDQGALYDSTVCP